MKILVTVKRVEDFEIKIKVKADGSGIETDQMKYVVNPFDEIAVEEGLRLKSAHSGEVVVASVGTSDATQQIRTALAMGADRGVLVKCKSAPDPWSAARALHKVVEQEKPDLVLMGKQAVDDDMGQAGILLAEMLGWAQASFASKESSLESQDEKDKVPGIKVADGRAEVVREVDGGLETVSFALPGVVSTDLRLNVPRYASLPGIMKAKKKEMKELDFEELVGPVETRVKILKLEPPKEREAGEIVADVPTLVQKLHNEAKVI